MVCAKSRTVLLLAERHSVRGACTCSQNSLLTCLHSVCSMAKLHEPCVRSEKQGVDMQHADMLAAMHDL